MKLLSLLGLLTVTVSATKLLLPLYLFPNNGAWDSIYKAVEKNGQLTFQIIINPDSGPGSPTPGDSSEYAAAVSRLRAYPNVQLFGYVHCGYGTGTADAVNKNVTQWSSWNSDPNIAIDGIFYDETPNEEGDKESVPYLASLVKTAKAAFGSRPFSSIFNPGARPEHLEFYDLADYVVVFEQDSSYSDKVLQTNIHPGRAGQSSILIYNFASQGTAELAKTWLQGMMAAGVGSAHVLNSGYSHANSDKEPAGIGAIASIMSFGGQGNSTGTPASASASRLSSASTPSHTRLTSTKNHSASGSKPAASTPSPKRESSLPHPGVKMAYMATPQATDSVAKLESPHKGKNSSRDGWDGQVDEGEEEDDNEQEDEEEDDVEEDDNEEEYNDEQDDNEQEDEEGDDVEKEDDGEEDDNEEEYDDEQDDQDEQEDDNEEADEDEQEDEGEQVDQDEQEDENGEEDISEDGGHGEED